MTWKRRSSSQMQLKGYFNFNPLHPSIYLALSVYMKLICIKFCARLEAILDLLMFRCWLSAAAQSKLKLANGTKCELTAAIYQIRPILYHCESQTGDVKKNATLKPPFGVERDLIESGISMLEIPQWHQKFWIFKWITLFKLLHLLQWTHRHQNL